jgi:hypothetical protein
MSDFCIFFSIEPIKIFFLLKDQNLCPKIFWVHIDRASLELVLNWKQRISYHSIAPDQTKFKFNLGSMLWSQFSAIFANFRRKNWRFSQKLIWHFFLQKLAKVWAKTTIFRQIFWRKYIKNFNIGPCFNRHPLSWQESISRSSDPAEPPMVMASNLLFWFYESVPVII